MPYIRGMQTTAPGGSRLIALYDGQCRICTREAKRLARLARKETVETRSFQDEGALDAFPGITHEAAMKRIHVVSPDGRVFPGAEGVARLATRIPIVGALAWLYYVPGLRQLAELGYRLVAKYRYRFGVVGPKGGRRPEDKCDTGTCHLHE